MRDGQRKQYSKGDQIHFIVTEDFVDVANEFVIFCDKNAMNVSRVIRTAITEWLQKKQIMERRLEKLEQGTASMQDFADAYERDVLREV